MKKYWERNSCKNPSPALELYVEKSPGPLVFGQTNFSFLLDEKPHRSDRTLVLGLETALDNKKKEVIYTEYTNFFATQIQQRLDLNLHRYSIVDQ